MTVKTIFNMSAQEFKRWLDSMPDDDLVGCIACGAIAGCCTEYPNCPGNSEWNPDEGKNDEISK